MHGSELAYISAFDAYVMTIQPHNSDSLIACETCGLVQRMSQLRPGETAECVRCGSRLAKSHRNSLSRTMAFSSAALILYIPANIFPILRMDYYGMHTENTVWAGCVSLFRDGQWPIAAVVFFASMVVPLFKLLALLFLSGTAKVKSVYLLRERTRLYQIVQAVGPWAMLDVFLMSILVALVKFKRLATVVPGTGLLAFTAVVVLTLLASASFDPRLIWQSPQQTK